MFGYAGGAERLCISQSGVAEMLHPKLLFGAMLLKRNFFHLHSLFAD